MPSELRYNVRMKSVPFCQLTMTLSIYYMVPFKAHPQMLFVVDDEGTED